MEITKAIIADAGAIHKKTCIAFSGGADSTVLLDIIYRYSGIKPPVIFANSQMEYPETIDHIKAVCEKYGADLHIAKADRTPAEQWIRAGYAMLGKLAGRLWTEKHRNNNLGFRVDCSNCCRTMKIIPARKLAVKLGCSLQFTGLRGESDGSIRGLRAIKDGAIYYAKLDHLTICNALTGWTDTMIRRYIKTHNLPNHPARARGAINIGCIACGGGAQFDTSAFRLMRKLYPAQWREYIVGMQLGYVILAIKYNQHIDKVKEAIKQLGGLEKIANERPFIFDFISNTILQGMNK